jgi:ribosomal protein S27AE
MAPSANFTGNPTSDDGRHRVRELEHQIARLQLMNQALWELLRERVQLTDADLERKAQEIDLRDGVQDGKISNTALKCPSCGRVSSSKHWKCLYCGLEFQKPVMG